jgi:hypothetical protein
MRSPRYKEFAYITVDRSASAHPYYLATVTQKAATMTTFAKSLRQIRSRSFASALLVYQFIFFNILLPGHTRGAITLDGKHTLVSVPCCCCGLENPAAKSTTGKSNGVPSQRDRDCCALCHFAARVLPTQFVGFTLPKMGLLDVLPVSNPDVPVSVDVIHTYQSRGPPLV